MAMVGLFWIAEDGQVYLGARPEGYGCGVRLTRDWVEGLGTGQSAVWGWSEIRSVAVRYVRVRSGARLLASTAVDLVAGGGEAAAAFEVHLVTAESTVELNTMSAAALGGYVRSEYDLSLALLDRIVSGAADVDTLARWGRAHAAEGTPRRERREALLRTWAAEG
ncbi:hypothetical protein F9278_26420 [Streptomyces phaeolivaceus]|uniref:Uncharacterized protein n=1 Tax=Streptomyces phaeolivaceus TaxID=2653200 RepID=A0A5P8K8E9_9ACTN|nr:hypothetical protein [Streptomyces phaeolivaceus]QFQ99092.1 hypothetical protein F9278_26420 [Streptomyces phaeolivaceus]